MFVTGTDTGVGKTFASCVLLAAWLARGLRASGMKPVASGSEDTPRGLRNEDALALLAASDPAPAYADCNPFAYQPAIAPHVTREVRPGADLATREQLGFYVRAATIPMFHPVGTAKMGAADDPQAVVGPDCRVCGLDGLWVADASIMPTIPQGNTNATAIMIGERASDLILDRLRGKLAA